MDNLKKAKKSIIKVLFWFNLISLIVSIFYVAPWFTLMITSINVILVGTYMVITKYGAIFEGLFMTNKIMKGMNNFIEEK